MDATLTSKFLILIIVLLVISVLITDDETPEVPVAKNGTSNTLVTQKIFRQCGNTPESNSICVKLLDDLIQGVISKDEFLNYIDNPDYKFIQTDNPVAL